MIIPSCYHLVDFLHGALASGLSGSSFFSRLLLRGLGFLVDVQTEGDKFVDTLSKASGLFNCETRNEEGGFIEKLSDRLDSAVVLTILFNLLFQLLDDGGAGRNFENLLGSHVRAHGGVTKSLGFHDTFHVGRPTELASTDGAGRADKLVGDDNLLNLVAEDVLESLGKTFIFLLLSLTSLLLLLGFLKLEVLGDVDEFLAIKLLELSHSILVNWVNQEQDFEILLLERVEEWGSLNSLERLASDVVNLFLVGLHASNVVSEGGQFITRFGGVETQKLSESGAVLSILVDSELDVLVEGTVELVELLAVLSDLVEKLNRLLHDVLLDDLHDLVLLESLTRQVEGKIFRVDNTLDEAEPFRDEVGSIVSDEDTADVKLDVVLGLLGLEKVEGGTLGHE